MTDRPIRSLPDGITFGPARPEDLKALVPIDRGSPQAWSEGAFAGEMRHDPPTLFVLRSSAGAIAFTVARLQAPEMDIVNLTVDPGCRRQGLGRVLLRALLEHSFAAGIRSVFLEVREGNKAARRLYRSAGFEESQRRRGFYREPVEDAILMRLEMSHQRG